MAKFKFYAVKKGRVPGIYTSWDECSSQVNGFPEALFRSFGTRQEAESWLDTPSSPSSRTKSPVDPSRTPTVYTDGSFLDGFDAYSYGVFISTPDGSQVELSGVASDPELVPSRNIAGETLAVIKATEWALDNGYSSLHVICDYIGIPEWATGSWKTRTKVARDFRQFILQKEAEGFSFSFEQVPGHSGIPGNERADQLAYQALMDAFNSSRS